MCDRECEELYKDIREALEFSRGTGAHTATRVFVDKALISLEKLCKKIERSAAGLEFEHTENVRISALYVEKDGVYFNLSGIDPWDEERDARLYDGPHPVIAHPPCQRWGKMWMGSPSYVAKTGIRKKKGDDGGCFEAALEAARKHGGVIEHPCDSHAWAWFGLNRPPRKGGWIKADDLGGWTCCVEQGRYGHYCRKPTWLLVYGVEEEDLPQLSWGRSEPNFPDWAIEKYGLAYCKRAGEMAFKGGGTDNKHRNGTPTEFRDLLIDIARKAKQ